MIKEIVTWRKSTPEEIAEGKDEMQIFETKEVDVPDEME